MNNNTQYLLIKLRLISGFVLGVVFFLFTTSAAYANVSSMYLYSLDSSGGSSGYVRTPDQSSCGTWSTNCWNNQSAGVTDCGNACSGGSAWTEYTYSGCYLDPVYAGDFIAIYVFATYACSSADKYVNSNPPVMNAGFCNCSVGGAYKTCCNGTSQVYAQHGNIDILPPDEAWCGSATVVYCGGSGQPACGQAACDTLALSPGSTPAPQPPPTVNACDPVGSWCNACNTKTCSDGSVCAAGHTYCTYASSGNYCGSACSEEINNCPTQCASGGSVVTVTPKYSCSGASCIRDDTNGPYTASDCGGVCTTGGGDTSTDYHPPAIHPYTQIRNVTAREGFPNSVAYNGASYDINNCGTDQDCLLAIESVNQTTTAQPGDTLEVRVMAHQETNPDIHNFDIYLLGDRAVHSDPNGLADDASGNQFCTNTAPDLTSFKLAGISCNNSDFTCQDSYNSMVNIHCSDPGNPPLCKSGNNYGWKSGRFTVSPTAVRGTQAGITAVVHMGGGFYTSNGSYGLNGATPYYGLSNASDYNYFRLKNHHPYCPWPNDEYYESLPLTVNIPTNKTCTINPLPASVTYPNPVTVTATGNANSTTSDNVNIWVEKTDGQPISPAPVVSGTAISPSIYNRVNYYYLSSCPSTTRTCTTQASTNLPVGSYYFHCDLQGNPGRCSGNPFCNGNEIGGTNCPGWSACSANDARLLTVNTAPPPTPSPLSVNCSHQPVSPTVPVNTSVRWSANPSGTAPFTYDWSGTDSLSGNTIEVPKTYTTTGTKTAVVRINSADGQTAQSPECSVIVNNNPLPWIYTDGDVHSNTRIYTPGGP